MSQSKPMPAAEAPLGREVTAGDLQAAFDGLFERAGSEEVDMVDTGSEAVAAQLRSLDANPEPDHFVIPSFVLNRTRGLNDGSHYGLGFRVHAAFADDFDPSEAQRLTEANVPRDYDLGTIWFPKGKAMIHPIHEGEDGELSGSEPREMSQAELTAFFQRFTNPDNIPIDDFQEKYWPMNFRR